MKPTIHDLEWLMLVIQEWEAGISKAMTADVAKRRERITRRWHVTYRKLREKML